MTRTRVLALTVTAALMVGGCDQRGRSDADLEAASSDAHARVVEVSDELVDTLLDGNPGVTFDVQGGPAGSAASWDCSDGPASDADAIQWSANRKLRVDPAQPTDTLLDPLIELLLDDGWKLADDEIEDITRSVKLTRDGFDVAMSGNHTVNGDEPTWVLLATYSPCLESPTPQPQP